MRFDSPKDMNKPLIVVNFKTYASASGQTAEDLAMAMEAHFIAQKVNQMPPCSQMFN